MTDTDVAVPLSSPSALAGWTGAMTEADRDRHELMMGLALEQAMLALDYEEVPVGCIVLHEPTGDILARAFNRTNIEKNVRRSPAPAAAHSAAR